MRLIIAKSSVVFLAIAAVIALPAAVKAQADAQPEVSAAADASVGVSGEQIGTETNYYCFRIPGYGWRCITPLTK